VNTAFNLANSLGAALIGVLLDRLALPWCFAVTAAPAVAVAVLAFGGRQSGEEGRNENRRWR